MSPCQHLYNVLGKCIKCGQTELPANYEETQASRTEVELGGEKLTTNETEGEPKC
jgi:hypothetical protein